MSRLYLTQFATIIQNTVYKIQTMILAFPGQTQIFSETCLKRPLINRQNEGLKAMWNLNAGQKYCRMLRGSIRQYFWLALSNYQSWKLKFLVFFWVAAYDRFLLYIALQLL